VADIGTDHALLPVYLIREGIASRVIAGDLNEGPLEAACNNIREAGLADRIGVRRGDGLDITWPGEVDTAVIAGMGGGTIRDILKLAGETAARLKRIVLQPMGDSGDLREWLAANGWRIEDEDLVREDGHIYEIILAVPGRETETDRTLVSIGPRLFEKKHPLLAEMIKAKIRKNRKIIAAMQLSRSPETGIKQQRLMERTRKLERIADACQVPDDN